MKLRCHFVSIALAAILLPLASFAGTPTVSGLTARQRYPWNGLVDISFTLSDNGCISVAATNVATGVAVPVRTLRDKSGNAVGKFSEFASGEVSLVWDAGADVPETLIEALALSVGGVPVPKKVQLWAGGPYWAETNIGAEEPEESGIYFWWGDTVGYRRKGSAWIASDGSSQNFSFSSGNAPTYNKSNSTLQSEGWITSSGVLAPEHDAAHVHWGGSWRMPTRNEISDLINNCDWTGTKRNGVIGYVVRGRGDFAVSSIFLPAAGHGNWTSIDSAGPVGYYWSSVPYERDSKYAWHLYSSPNSSSHSTYYNYDNRYYGFPVRPVQGFAH